MSKDIRDRNESRKSVHIHHADVNGLRKLIVRRLSADTGSDTKPYQQDPNYEVKKIVYIHEDASPFELFCLEERDGYLRMENIFVEVITI